MPAHMLTITLAIAGFLQGNGIHQVAWLQGCWRMSAPGRLVEENWTAPRGRSMLGVSRTVRGDSLVAYELVVVREAAAGLSYEAHPSGQPSATFPARTATDSTVVFENTAHDFPQRIGYRRSSGDSLLAWIEGHVQGNVRRIEFRHARVACAGELQRRTN